MLVPLHEIFPFGMIGYLWLRITDIFKKVFKTDNINII